MLRFSSSLLLLLLLSLAVVLSLISSTSATATSSDTSTNDIITKFKSAREARKAGSAAQVAVTSTTTTTDREAGAVEFESRRAALLAQAAQNAPLERDVEWEQQLLDDRRSVHFSRDRSIIDDTQHVGSIAGIRPSEL